MKNHLCFLIILLPFSGFCQNPDTLKSTTASRRIEVGVLFSPDYSYRTITPEQSSVYPSIATSRNNTEVYKITYTTGVACIYPLSKRIALYLDIAFSDKGYKSTIHDLLFNAGINPVRGFVYSSMGTINLTYHYYYLDIPIKGSYYFIAKRIKLYASLGLSTNIYLSDYNTSVVNYNDGTTTNNTEKVNNGFSSINLQAVVDIGAGYDISRKLYLCIEPGFNYSINSIIQAPIKEYLYSLGVNTSVYWRF